MAIGDMEHPLRQSNAKEIVAWASAWGDLMQAGQMIRAWRDIPSDDHGQIFQRKALIDAALVAYGRLFNGGKRRDVVDLLPWIGELGPDSVALHRELMAWRNSHIAHRGDAAKEQTKVSLLWQAFGQVRPELRIRVETSLTPDADLIGDFDAMRQVLQNWIWERKLWVIQQQWLATLGDRGLAEMMRRAQPPHDGPTVEQAIRVTFNVGSARPSPTRPYRRLPSRIRRSTAR